MSDIRAYVRVFPGDPYVPPKRASNRIEPQGACFPQYGYINERAEEQVVDIERRVHSGYTEPCFDLIRKTSGIRNTGERDYVLSLSGAL